MFIISDKSWTNRRFVWFMKRAKCANDKMKADKRGWEIVLRWKLATIKSDKIKWFISWIGRQMNTSRFMLCHVCMVSILVFKYNERRYSW